jgi:hypothetical protein
MDGFACAVTTWRAYSSSAGEEEGVEEAPMIGLPPPLFNSKAKAKETVICPCD